MMDPTDTNDPESRVDGDAEPGAGPPVEDELDEQADEETDEGRPFDGADFAERAADFFFSTPRGQEVVAKLADTAAALGERLTEILGNRAKAMDADRAAQRDAQHKQIEANSGYAVEQARAAADLERQRVANEAAAAAKRAEHDATIAKWASVERGVGLVIVLLILAVLGWNQKVAPEVAGLLGSIAGYLFGKSPKT